MESEEYCTQIELLLNTELEEIMSTLPSNPLDRSAWVLEMIRVLDLRTLALNDSPEEAPIHRLIWIGWNLAFANLFDQLPGEGFPHFQSTPETRLWVLNILSRLGSIGLLGQCTEMIRAGLMEVTYLKQGTIILRSNSIVSTQLLDVLEFSEFDELINRLQVSEEPYMDSWAITTFENLHKIQNQAGAFVGKPYENDFSHFRSDNIDSLMLPLVRPWYANSSIMDYDSTREIDEHFLTVAWPIVDRWRTDAGFHPHIKLEKVTSEAIVAIVVFITSLHLKHIHFAQIAIQKHKQISFEQSITVWCPLDIIKKAIIGYTGINPSIIDMALNVVTVRKNEIDFLNTHFPKFMPLLLDMGNGYVIRPISSIESNPFFYIITLMEKRDSNIRHRISQPREAWQRENLYGLFAGNRYLKCKRNVNLKRDNNIVTDIDAAVYDITNGEIAIFQLKWQDYFNSDVRVTRSKASNLTKDLDSWGEKVTEWISVNGIHKLFECLRLKVDSKVQDCKVYLFAISATKVRMKGFGYTTKCENIAISNWPQFYRNRFKIGPAKRTIHNLFVELKAQEAISDIPFSPIQVNMDVGNTTFILENFWFQRAIATSFVNR